MRETDSSYYIMFTIPPSDGGIAGYKKIVWIPKNQLFGVKIDGDSIKGSIPDWLMFKKGIQGLLRSNN